MAVIKLKSIRLVDNEEPPLRLTFLAADTDSDTRGPAYQQKVKAAQAAIEAAGYKVQPRVDFQKSESGGTWLSGEMLLFLSGTASALMPVISMWISSKLGRKVRIKVGEVEIEAANLKQVEALIDQIQAIKDKSDRQS